MTLERAKQRGMSAFTLIELLVVIAIIGTLTAIIVPAMGAAQEAARQAVCLANLHSVGEAIELYGNENHSYYPPMAVMPSIESTLNPLAPRPAMSEILEEYLRGGLEVLHCPSDQIPPDISVGPDAGEKTYFEWQGSSYQPILDLSNVNIDEWELSREGRLRPLLAEMFQDMVARTVLVHDYEAFHHRRADEGNVMALYADFHSAPMADAP